MDGRDEGKISSQSVAPQVSNFDRRSGRGWPIWPTERALSTLWKGTAVTAHSPDRSPVAARSESGFWLWLACSALLYVATGTITLLAAATIENLALVPAGMVGAGSFGHGVVLAGHVASWGVSNVVGVVVAARILLPAARTPSTGTWIVAGAGLSLAAALQLALYEWSRDRFVYFDPEYVGLSAVLPAFLVAQASTLLAVSIAPRGRVGLPLFALGAASVVNLGIVATNVPGAMDGIEPGSLVLALLVATVVPYMIATALVAAAAARAAAHPSARP